MGKRKNGIIGAFLILGALCMLGGCSSLTKNTKAQAPFEAKVKKAFICGSYNGDVLVVNLDVKNTSKEYVDGNMVSYAIEAKSEESTLKPSYIGEKNPNYISPEKIATGKSGVVQAVFELGDAKEEEVSLLGVTHSQKSGDQVEFLKETLDLAKVERVVSESAYELTIDSATASDDGDGHDIVILDMTFTNNSDAAVSFGTAINLQLFQNKIELKTGYLPYKHPSYDENLESNTGVDIQTGASLKIRRVYILNDKSMPVEVKAVDYSSYDQASILEKEIQLQ